MLALEMSGPCSEVHTGAGPAANSADIETIPHTTAFVSISRIYASYISITCYEYTNKSCGNKGKD
jgi:hypothetical protein